MKSVCINLANTFKTVKHKTIAPGTISTYLGYFMENIIFNELKVRGYDVDVGVVEHNSKDANGKSHRNYLEIDFVANKGSRRFYIQSALHVDDEEKRTQETNSLRRVNDSFKKIIILKDNIEQWQDDNGIQYVGVEQFLLDKAFLS